MKAIHVLTLLLLCTSMVKAQEVLVTIHGVHKYTQQFESRAIQVSFINTDQKSKFENRLKEQGINYEIIKVDQLALSDQARKYYIHIDTVVHFNRALELCKQEDIKTYKVAYKFAAHDAEAEDDQAILAFEDAEEKATAIAKNLGYHNIEVVHIDDDTTTRFFDAYRSEDSENEELVNLMESFVNEYSSGLYRVTPFEERSYELIVTFKLYKNHK